MQHNVVGVNSKQFFTFRDGDIAYTLQRSANSFGQFLLLNKLKVGGSRRSVIIPEGGAKNGWRMFGIELRKMMYPSQYAVGSSSQLKLVAPLRRQNSEIQNSRTFAEMVQDYHVKLEDRKHPMQSCATDKGKTQIGEEKMVPDPEHAKKVVSGRLVVNSCPLAAGGGAVKPWSINGDINLGEKILAGNKLRFPLWFNSNSKEPGLGSTQLTVANFSSPSSHEMGEPSAKASPTPLAHSATMAKAFSNKPKSPMLTEVVADRQAEPLMVVQRSCLSGTSSDSLTVGRMEVGISADGSAVVSMMVNSGLSVGLNSDRLVMGWMEARISSDRIAVALIEGNSSFSDGFNFAGLAVTQLEAGISSDGSAVAPTDVVCSFSDGFNSDGLPHTRLVQTRAQAIPSVNSWQTRP